MSYYHTSCSELSPPQHEVATSTSSNLIEIETNSRSRSSSMNQELQPTTTTHSPSMKKNNHYHEYKYSVLMSDQLNNHANPINNNKDDRGSDSECELQHAQYIPTQQNYEMASNIWFMNQVPSNSSTGGPEAHPSMSSISNGTTTNIVHQPSGPNNNNITYDDDSGDVVFRSLQKLLNQFSVSVIGILGVLLFYLLFVPSNKHPPLMIVVMAMIGIFLAFAGQLLQSRLCLGLYLMLAAIAEGYVVTILISNWFNVESLVGASAVLLFFSLFNGTKYLMSITSENTKVN